jgi:hypothetical protein
MNAIHLSGTTLSAAEQFLQVGLYVLAHDGVLREMPVVSSKMRPDGVFFDQHGLFWARRHNPLFDVVVDPLFVPRRAPIYAWSALTEFRVRLAHVAPFFNS